MECPKCMGPMRAYERNGITVDQCTECRGVFLDRGELELLISLEAASSARPEAPKPRYDDRGYGEQYPSHNTGYSQQYSSGYGGKPPKRKKSFLEEFFD